MFIYYDFGFGKDVITDFDAEGGSGKQDYLLFGDNIPAFDVIQDGKDVVLSFDSGDEIILKNVVFSTFTVDDYSPFG